MEQINIRKLYLNQNAKETKENNIKTNERLKDFLNTNGLSLESNSFAILCLKEYMELGHHLPPEETLKLQRIYLMPGRTAPSHLFSEFMRNKRDQCSREI